jgi:hypothetical protein
VYAQRDVLTDSNAPVHTDAVTAPPHAVLAPPRLEVRNASGLTTELGDEPDDDPWSLSGPILAGGSLAGAVSPTQADYWNLATGAHGTITVPAKSDFAAAAPDGIVYETAAGNAANAVAGHLYLRHPDGSTADLGRPFSTYSSIVSGDDGLVVTDGDQAKYMSFASPRTFAALAPVVSTWNLVCQAVAAGYAGCHEEDGDGNYKADQIVPLDGEPATRTTVSPGDAAVSGSTLVWNGTTTGSTRPHLLSLPTGSGEAPTSSSQGLGYTGGLPVVSAYGEVVADAADDSTLYAAHDSSDVTTVVAATKSPVTAAAFALTAHHVIYNDDQQQPDGSSVSQYAARYTQGKTGETIDGTSLLKAGVYSDTVAAAGSDRVYAEKTGAQTVKLVVVSPTRTHTINRATKDEPVSISGQRVLYFVAGTGEHGETAYVYNLNTNRSTQERSFSSCCGNNQYVALTGKTFAYAKSDDSVWKKNLSTDKRVKVKAPPRHAIDVEVYAANHRVGWTFATGTANEPTLFSGYRNVKKMGRPVSTGHDRLWQLADTGVVLAPPDATSVGGHGEVDTAVGFRFRPFGGHTSRLLAGQKFIAGPQVRGSTVAWIDERGVLKLAPVG